MSKGLRWDLERKKHKEVRSITDENKWRNDDAAARWLSGEEKLIKNQKKRNRKYKKWLKRHPYKDDVALEVLNKGVSGGKPPWED